MSTVTADMASPHQRQFEQHLPRPEARNKSVRFMPEVTVHRSEVACQRRAGPGRGAHGVVAAVGRAAALTNSAALATDGVCRLKNGSQNSHCSSINSSQRRGELPSPAALFGLHQPSARVRHLDLSVQPAPAAAGGARPLSSVAASGRAGSRGGSQGSAALGAKRGAQRPLSAPASAAAGPKKQHS